MTGPSRDVSAAVVVALALCGCAGMQPEAGSPVAPTVRDSTKGSPRPARENPSFHTVRRGDTLHAIAWRYGLDYRSIAKWNRIADPHVIYPGQRLALRAPAAEQARASTSRLGAGKERPRNSSAKKSAKAKPGTKAPAKAKPSAKAAAKKLLAWPARGRVVGRFGGTGNDGIDIAGRRGQPVAAARGGQVVYSGSALVGYGRLVIIKHSKRLLTAYAHNDRILVREGQEVRTGEQIATMGSTGTNRVKLHFEVRRDGKPVDPLRYLPR